MRAFRFHRPSRLRCALRRCANGRTRYWQRALSQGTEQDETRHVRHRHPRDDPLRWPAGHEGLRPQQNVLLLQFGGEPRGVQARRGCVLRQIQSHRGAAPGLETPERAGAAPCRGQHLLSRQVGRHLRSERLNRSVRSSEACRNRSSKTCSCAPEVINTWQPSSVPSRRLTFPSLARPSRGWQNEPFWKPFFDGYTPVHEWLASVRPNVAVVIYNDHGLNFFLDRQPTFAIGAASEYRNEDEGWGLPVVAPYPGPPSCRGT